MCGCRGAGRDPSVSGNVSALDRFLETEEHSANYVNGRAVQTFLLCGAT